MRRETLSKNVNKSFEGLRGSEALQVLRVQPVDEGRLPPEYPVGKAPHAEQGSAAALQSRVIIRNQTPEQNEHDEEEAAKECKVDFGLKAESGLRKSVREKDESGGSGGLGSRRRHCEGNKDYAGERKR
jgi:hypothetical protein